MQRSLLLVFCLFFFAARSEAQVAEHTWERLFDSPTAIWTVHFLDLGGPPRIGFVGCNEAVYRTTDGGNTWAPCTVTAPEFIASDFTFKDSLTGWFANYNFSSSKQLAMCYKTTDGGLTWNPIYGPTVYTSSVLYRPENHLLLLASWRDNAAAGSGYSCYSTDEGLTWKSYWEDQRLNGFAFLDDNNGVTTSAGLLYIRTTDGGYTWDWVNATGSESWQPVASVKSGIYLASSETSGELFSSIDNGVTFRLLGKRLGFTTGTIREGSCGVLYSQYALGSAYQHLGIVRSQDAGATWTSLGGPVNKNDTRFYVKGSYLFAGGIDTTTKKYSLWRYVEDSTFYDGGSYDTPQVSDSVLDLVSEDCGALDSTLAITYLNDCSPAELLSVELSTTSRFAIALNDTLPARLSGVYRIPILYSPVGHDGDTAYLTLVYRTHGTDKTVVVKVVGSVPGQHTIARFALQASGQGAVTSSAGAIVPIDLMLLNDLPNALGVNTIAFDLTYDENVATPVGLIINPPWSLLSESHTFGRESIAFRRQDGVDLLANSSVATFQFKTFLTTTNSTTVTASNFLLNDGDSVYLGCTATATDPGAVIYVVSDDSCGDALLRRFIMNQSIVEVLGETVRVSSPYATTAVVSVYDVLGHDVYREPVALTPKAVDVSLSGFKPGVYFGRVEGVGLLPRSFRFVKR